MPGACRPTRARGLRRSTTTTRSAAWTRSRPTTRRSSGVAMTGSTGRCRTASTTWPPARPRMSNRSVVRPADPSRPELASGLCREGNNCRPRRTLSGRGHRRCGEDRRFPVHSAAWPCPHWRSGSATGKVLLGQGRRNPVAFAPAVGGRALEGFSGLAAAGKGIPGRTQSSTRLIMVSSTRPRASIRTSHLQRASARNGAR
jgi:hypothetical protein